MSIVRDDDEQRVFCVHHLSSLLLWFVSVYGKKKKGENEGRGDPSVGGFTVVLCVEGG